MAAALKSALRNSVPGAGRPKKHVHFKAIECEVRDITRSSLEVAESTEHRLSYYTGFITTCLDGANQCLAEASSMVQRVEAAALRAAIEASIGGHAFQFRRAATLDRVAAGIHGEIEGIERSLSIIRTAMDMAQGALERAEAAANAERAIARERGNSPECLSPDSIKEPINIARHAWRVSEAALTESKVALARVNRAAHSVLLERDADTDYFGGAAGSSSDDSDDDLSDLAADFDRALLE